MYLHILGEGLGLRGKVSVEHQYIGTPPFEVLQHQCGGTGGRGTHRHKCMEPKESDPEATPTFMNDHLLQLPLGGGPLHNLLIDGVCCDQAEHQHRLGLANPVAAVLGLQVCLRILGENKKKKEAL